LVVITDIGKTLQNCGGRSFSVRACATISGSSVQNFSNQGDGTEVLTFTKRFAEALRVIGALADHDALPAIAFDQRFYPPEADRPSKSAFDR